MKYVLMMAFVSFLPPVLYLLGLLVIYTMAFVGLRNVFTTLVPMPKVNTLVGVAKRQYAHNKKLMKGGAPLNSSTSSPVPNGAANASNP